MNKLTQALEQEDNKALTANYAESYASTLDANLDWFGKVGALRGQGEKAKGIFQKALAEDPLKALKILFYGRDIRGGQGERDVFYNCVQYLAKNYPQHLAANIGLIVEYGYWKDLFVLFDTGFEDTVLDLIREQWIADIESDKPSLMAKWLPSENTSSKVTKAHAKKVREHLGLTPREYRKSLSGLREKLKVVERDLSAGRFGDIDYGRVPSKANLRYAKAFLKHDEDRYRKFLDAVTSGEKKMNAAALYPYDIVTNYIRGSWNCNASRPTNDKALQALWKSLPDYLEGKPHRGLVVCDVSGSMTCQYTKNSKVRPIDVSVSLALYMAERNTGPFKDTFLTFTSSPSFVKLRGDDLYTRIGTITKADWGGSTNVQAAFKLILQTAVKHQVPATDMPSVVYIVSDMQFNSCVNGTNIDGIRAQYQAAGYEVPKLVFWNVNSYSDVPITQHDENTALVSGCNPNIFEAILGGKTPTDVMNAVVESDRYEPISIG